MLAKTNIIWIDLEMTGLNVDKDRIIEIATVVTDKNLNILAKGPVIAIHQPAELIQAMDSWNTKHHGQSGLIERVRNSVIDEAQAQAMTLKFLQQYVSENVSPMAGNSICQDRRFLHRWMKPLESYFHYRNLDVSSLKILADYWGGKNMPRHQKNSSHQAMDDVLDSIEELKFYREHMCTFDKVER